MKQLKLVPRSNHGKNRINQHGEIWNIIEERASEFVLESLNQTFKLGENWVHDGRRVDKVDDKNFNWERI